MSISLHNGKPDKTDKILFWIPFLFVAIPAMITIAALVAKFVLGIKDFSA